VLRLGGIPRGMHFFWGGCLVALAAACSIWFRAVYDEAAFSSLFSADDLKVFSIKPIFAIGVLFHGQVMLIL
jgi:hypothetical protein